MSKITLEHGEDLRGNGVVIARKARGKISVYELEEAMRDNHHLYGGWWAILFMVSEDMGYQGWMDAIPQGDALELYKIDDWETCPVCAATFSGITFCPHCGEGWKQDAK